MTAWTPRTNATASVMSSASRARSERERTFATMGRACMSSAVAGSEAEWREVVADKRFAPFYRERLPVAPGL
jgi:hypothetical protein